MRLDRPDGTRIGWEINDPVDGEGWSSAQLDTIRRLLPHVCQTARVQQALASAGALGATLTELLDATTGVGIIQLDARGQIVVANDRARHVLRSGDGLFDRGGSLFARAPRDNDNLRGLLSRALPPFGAQGAGGSTTIRRTGDLPPLVLVVDSTSGAAIDPAAAAAALDLTRMESRVAVLLAQGKSVREIVAMTGRKESTIRSHVKHMFAKHGLSRQAELVRMVSALADIPGVRRRG